MCLDLWLTEKFICLISLLIHATNNIPVQSLSCVRTFVMHRISFEMLFIRSYLLKDAGMVMKDILKDDFDV